MKFPFAIPSAHSTRRPRRRGPARRWGLRRITAVAATGIATFVAVAAYEWWQHHKIGGYIITQEEAGAALENFHLTDERIVGVGRIYGDAAMTATPEVCLVRCISLRYGFTAHASAAVTADLQMVLNGISYKAIEDGGGHWHLLALVNLKALTTQLANLQVHPSPDYAGNDDFFVELYSAVMDGLHLRRFDLDHTGRTLAAVNMAEQDAWSRCSGVINNPQLIASAIASAIHQDLTDYANGFSGSSAMKQVLQELLHNPIHIQPVRGTQYLRPGSLALTFPPAASITPVTVPAPDVLSLVHTVVRPQANGACTPSGTAQDEMERAEASNLYLLGAS
jgi:hypothetical protein